MSNSHDHFITLCNLWCEEQLSPDQLGELQTLLRCDRVLRATFVEFVQLHGQLTWDAGLGIGSQPANDTSEISTLASCGTSRDVRSVRHSSRYQPRMVAFAAAGLVLVGVLTFNFRGMNALQMVNHDVRQNENSDPNSTTTQSPDSQVASNHDGASPESTGDELKPLELNGIRPSIVSPEDPSNSPATNDIIVATPVDVPSANDDAAVIGEIDRLIAVGWSENGVNPADTADDHEWVRRCYLTLTGCIPTVNEVSSFVARQSPRKRMELVDALLEDQRFAENLSVTWSNLLIGRRNTRGVNQDALFDFLLKQFAENRPWMETVGDLIAAEGRSDQNGATNFLLAHLNDQATPATAVTARLFLGQQVQCTQCHDHPFAKDRHQDEFWSLNAFFKQAERQTLMVENGDGKPQPVWILKDSEKSPGMTFYDTLRGQKKAVLPEFDGHTMSADDAGSRRSELVRLLAGDSHQLVAQAMVNRTWFQVFGHGFTNPVDDLGPHNPVSHPELMQLLTKSFADSNYDVRRLMRWLTLSQTFQLSCEHDEQFIAADDPEEGGTPLFSRAYPRSMAPEQVYDSIRIAIRSAADQPIDSSIGSQHRREWVEQFVQSYGTDENDEQLAFDGNISQALLMMNGEEIQTAIPLTAAEVTKSAHAGPNGVTKSLERIAMATLNREPSEGEETVFRNRYRSLSGSLPAEQAIRTATEDMLWAYLNSSEFTSVH